MTPDEYLQSLISRYHVTAGQINPASIVYDSISPIIKAWAGSQLREIKYSGSYAKGTAIHGGTDIDLFISLKSDTQQTLQQIYNMLYDKMNNAGYLGIRKQNVSIHVNHAGFEVDLVPAVHLGGNTEDHWLYVNRANRERTKTNVDAHISMVRNSGRIGEIVLAKIWRKNHNIDIPSIYLELIVIESLKYSRSGLGDNLLKVLDYLSNSFVLARFVDPANTNNIISDELNATEKQTIANQALQSRRGQNWGGIIW
ncbi:MAG: nucleotidyltransferase domain-containing protein [Candidatus Margulisbacteria bacterium]|nr:nucleotidyltransferase domain-containing protein [Candidatus Margulisiibacteriota bacterium]MBU1617511.1 nucleotidyltransferase domain-containing protein [Candidatus Margulisiibacteriota bacterium]